MENEVEFLCTPNHKPINKVNFEHSLFISYKVIHTGREVDPGKQRMPLLLDIEAIRKIQL
jgi:hypothetical protein